jgi:hypothetical protein
VCGGMACGMGGGKRAGRAGKACGSVTEVASNVADADTVGT